MYFFFNIPTFLVFASNFSNCWCLLSLRFDVKIIKLFEVGFTSFNAFVSIVGGLGCHLDLFYNWLLVGGLIIRLILFNLLSEVMTFPKRLLLEHPIRWLIIYKDC